MKFVGIELTSAFAAKPRLIDIALLDDQLNARFSAVAWPMARAYAPKARENVAVHSLLDLAFPRSSGIGY